MRIARPKHGTVVAYLALVLALSGSAMAAPGISNKGNFYNSGLIKLDIGEQTIVTQRGPFQFKFFCNDAGAGESAANLQIKNTGTAEGHVNSPFKSGTDSFSAGDTATAAYSPTANSEIFADYVQFSAVAGKTSLTGSGTIGNYTAGADCVLQLVLVG